VRVQLVWVSVLMVVMLGCRLSTIRFGGAWENVHVCVILFLVPWRELAGERGACDKGKTGGVLAGAEREPLETRVAVAVAVAVGVHWEQFKKEGGSSKRQPSIWAWNGTACAQNKRKTNERQVVWVRPALHGPRLALRVPASASAAPRAWSS